MAPCWEPGTSYTYDDVVEYEGTTLFSSRLGLREVLTIDQVTDTRSSSHIAPRLDYTHHSSFLNSSLTFLDDVRVIGRPPLLLPFGDV